MEQARAHCRHTPLREWCPVTTAITCVRLTAAEAVGAPFDRRFASIWNWLIHRAGEFQKRLRPRERAHFDLGDTLQELWIELAQNDSKWDHHRGNYITFANRVVQNKLVDLYEHARVVKAPRNAYSRYRQFTAPGMEATLSPSTRVLVGRLAGVIAPQESLDENRALDPGADPDACPAQDDEARRQAQAAVVRGLGALSRPQAAVITRLYGLGDTPALSAADTARDLGLSVHRVRTLEATALLAMRTALTTGAAGLAM